MPSSTILGSIIISLTCSGVDLYSRLRSRELRQTDLPEPVVPAMSMCGSFAMLPTTQRPDMSLPIAKDSVLLAFLNSGDSITSRRYTILTILFGTSMPTVLILSGIGAMRTFITPRLRAMSLARLVSFVSFTPASSSKS